MGYKHIFGTQRQVIDLEPPVWHSLPWEAYFCKISKMMSSLWMYQNMSSAYFGLFCKWLIFNKYWLFMVMIDDYNLSYGRRKRTEHSVLCHSLRVTFADCNAPISFGLSRWQAWCWRPYEHASVWTAQLH